MKSMTNMDSIQWRVPSVGALLLVLVFMPHLFSKVPYVNAAWVFFMIFIIVKSEFTYKELIEILSFYWS